MGFHEDQPIEQTQKERENLEANLDEIETYGERFEWYVGAILQYPS